MLDEQAGEVGGEPLAEPHVVPIALGDRIAEPLVGDLVDDDIAPANAAVAGD